MVLEKTNEKKDRVMKTRLCALAGETTHILGNQRQKVQSATVSFMQKTGILRIEWAGNKGT